MKFPESFRPATAYLRQGHLTVWYRDMSAGTTGTHRPQTASSKDHVRIHRPPVWRSGVWGTLRRAGSVRMTDEDTTGRPTHPDSSFLHTHLGGSRLTFKSLFPAQTAQDAASATSSMYVRSCGPGDEVVVLVRVHPWTWTHRISHTHTFGQRRNRNRNANPLTPSKTHLPFTSIRDKTEDERTDFLSLSGTTD